MTDPLLNIGDHLTGISRVPAPVQFLGGYTELDDEIAGQIKKISSAQMAGGSSAVRIGLETGPLTSWLWTALTAEGLPNGLSRCPSLNLE